jgi:hypothetical protein
MAMLNLSEKKLHKIGRIDQIVRDYFADRPTEKEVSAKNLMPLFIEKGIFEKDNRAGLPIRSLLRQLDAAGKLNLLKHAFVVRKEINRNWYFVRSEV